MAPVKEIKRRLFQTSKRAIAASLDEWLNTIFFSTKRVAKINVNTINQKCNRAETMLFRVVQETHNSHIVLVTAHGLDA